MLMKISKAQLKQIIKEEAQKALHEDISCKLGYAPSHAGARKCVPVSKNPELKKIINSTWAKAGKKMAFLTRGPTTGYRFGPEFDQLTYLTHMRDYLKKEEEKIKKMFNKNIDALIRDFTVAPEVEK